MKKILGIASFLLFGFAATSHAQTVEKVEQKVEEGAKKVGNKTAQVASKSKAKITDEVYKDKEGPNGEKVYIDNHSKYYYIDKKGKRHYATDAELKDKTEE